MTTPISGRADEKTAAAAKSDAIAKRAIAHHRGEPPPSDVPTAAATRVVAGMKARGFSKT